MELLQNFQEALDFLYAQLPMYHRIGAAAYKKDLTNTMALLDAMDNPQESLRCIHIAGTNGKGSVTHIIAAILQHHGYQVGVYTSPHYITFRERIKINGNYIDEEYIVNFLNNHHDLIHRIQPSFFELTVAMAFSYFKVQNIDYVIIETGLGGRLDSTNVIHPLLSVITNISMDHKDMLGDSLEKIASEKAGIIKSNVPVVIGRRQVETTPVFISKAYAMQSKLYYAEDEVQLNYSNKLEETLCLKFANADDNNVYSFKPDLKGVYQIENYRTALASINILSNDNVINIDKKTLLTALEHVAELSNMIGRWQRLDSAIATYVESAHNEDGIRMLNQQIDQLEFESLHLVVGFVKDKEIHNILSLLPRNAKYYFVAADIPRALDSDSLRLQANDCALLGNSYDSVHAGYLAAINESSVDDVIIVSGSIFVVGELLGILKGLEN